MKTERKGPTPDDVLAQAQERLAGGVLANVRRLPEFFEGAFRRTGYLMAALTALRTPDGGGAIVPPAGRLEDPNLRRRFVELVKQLAARGLLWPRKVQP